jgi:hypothetical protein
MKRFKKLSLNRETIRALTTPQLSNVAGAVGCRTRMETACSTNTTIEPGGVSYCNLCGDSNHGPCCTPDDFAQ